MELDVNYSLRYLPAKRMVMGSQAGVAVVAILLRIYYGIVNRMRDRKAAEEVGETAVLVEDMAWLNCSFPRPPFGRSLLTCHSDGQAEPAISV
jgi:hypothetical protein